MSALHLFTSKGNRFAFIASLCISILALLFITPVKPAFAAQSVIVTVGNPNGGNLAGAYVSANGGMSGGCTTNSLGSCSINLPSPGNYTIRASYGSYIPASVYRYFGAGQTISIRLNLSWGDGTGGPAPTTPPAQPTVSPLTTAYTCVYRNGQLLSSATVQLSGYAEVATGDGCHTYTIYKNQTIYITARANGQVKSQSVYVGQSAVSMRFDMPALSTPPKVSGTPPGTGQTLPKQINVSIKRSNGALHTELVTISLKNTSTGQVTTRSTTSGYYAFTNLLGGSYPYEVGASLSNVSPYNISGPQAFTLGSGTKEVTFAVLPKNPGITKTPPTLAPNTTVNVTVTVKRGTNVVDKASVYICKAGASGTGNVTCPNGTTDSQGKVTLKVAANTAYTVEASQATSVGKVNLTTSTTSRSIEVQLAGTANVTLPSAQQYQLSGTIYHQENGKIVPYKGSAVKVIATNSEGKTRTVTTITSTGQYFMGGLNAKFYTVSITPPAGKKVSPVSQEATFSNVVNERILSFTLTDVVQPTAAPAKVNLTVKTQERNGAAISGVTVAVDPDGRGSYTTNSEGMITAVVNKNTALTITASKPGLVTVTKTYTIGTANVQMPLIMVPSASAPPTGPTQPPVTPTTKRTLSGKISVLGKTGVYTGSVQVTLTNLRTKGVASLTTSTGAYTFNNLNNVDYETYEVRATLLNAPTSYGISAPVRVQLRSGQHGTANFTVTQSASNTN